MELLTTILQVLYVASTVGLAIVGFNSLLLSLLYLRKRKAEPPTPPTPDEADLPPVLVQLPIFNERHVVERLIETVARLDYPRDRLTVQVLDDSTDDTVAIAAAAVEAARSAGLQIEHVRRGTREGYKAGALAYGLEQNDAPLVAIFDADFTPPPGFLREVVPYFLTDDRLGLVQTRWAHLNEQQNLLTRGQALALDAHFIVEQTARHRNGLFMNFSGTAGVWRRVCIEDSGGWHHDTLSEDIDLSYRAQLRGWRFLYLPGVGVPAEIPPLMMGLKRQQSRWATGTVQCLRKMGGTLIRSHLTPWQKIEALLHLGGYFLHPLMLIVLLLTLPLLLLGGLNNLPLAGLGLAMLGSPVQVTISQRALHRDNWARRLLVFPALLLGGMGIAVSNTAAVLRGLSGRAQPFERTPKFQARGADRGWAASSYALLSDLTTTLEVLMALYAAATAAVALTRLPAVVPFMVLYALAFLHVAGVSAWQSRAARRVQRRQRQQFRLSGSEGR